MSRPTDADEDFISAKIMSKKRKIEDISNSDSSEPPQNVSSELL
jgi:hypothetical protein